MEEVNPFAEFLRRLRAHDEVAAKRLVDVYGPVILRAAGRRLSGLGLSREVDPEDIAQEVFAKFLVEIGKRLELASSEDVIKLLVTMTHHAIADAYRHAHAKRRRGQKHLTQQVRLEEMVSPGGQPDQELIEQEDLDRVHQLMSREEWNLAMARACGQRWNQLATELGQNADALRKKFVRAIARAREDLEPE